jgi:hypothetical protein
MYGRHVEEEAQMIKGMNRGELPGGLVYEVGHKWAGFLRKRAMIEE